MTFAVALLLLQTAAAPAGHPTPLDTLVDAGGYQLHLRVSRGHKPITIVMESGGGATLDAWSGVDTVLAERTGATVVAYDRAGFGASSLGPWSLTPREQVVQLDHVLDRLGTSRDRILVGHSYGGLLATMHAHLFAGRVRGLVLVDPMNARFAAATGDFLSSTVPHNDHPSTTKDSAVARMVRTFGGFSRDPEASDVGVRAPIVLITAGDAWWNRPDIDRTWRASHEAMVQAGRNRRLVVADRSNHDVPERRPDTIVEAVLSLTGR